MAACCVVNYYFFRGHGHLYGHLLFPAAAVQSWRISLKDFLLLALEAVLGLGLACVLLVPSVLVVVQNYRTSSYINGWNAVLYNQNQRYLHILSCFFSCRTCPPGPISPRPALWASTGRGCPSLA